ncbi:MAG: PaaI family thioesterase [Bryobacteraceae bacterium]
MALAVTKQDIEALISGWPFIRNAGYVVESLGDGECTLRVPFREATERPGGVVSGPTYMGAADGAMWIAILTRLGIDDGSVTSEMKTNFLAGARREDFWCHAKILKLGRRLIYGVAECTTADGKLVAHHTLTYFRPEARP